MKRIFFLAGLLVIFHTANGQNWTLKDSGVGLIVEEESNKKRPKIIQRNTIWDAKDLYENGAQEGKYNGNQLFAAWIQGPETKEFLNRKGLPVWMYKYRITYPDGKTFESEPRDFFSSGFSWFTVGFVINTEGIWKIEWFINNRDTRKTSQVATTIFQTKWGKP